MGIILCLGLLGFYGIPKPPKTESLEAPLSFLLTTENLLCTLLFWSGILSYACFKPVCYTPTEDLLDSATDGIIERLLFRYLNFYC